MPEAQRETMRQMMQKQFGAAAVERRVELKKRGERVNAWTADRDSGTEKPLLARSSARDG
jgi:hypothetical protein